MELITLEGILKELRELNETMERIDRRGVEQAERAKQQDQKMDRLFDPILTAIPSVIAFLAQNVKVSVSEVPWDDPHWKYHEGGL